MITLLTLNFQSKHFFFYHMKHNEFFFPDTFCKSVLRKPTPRDFFIGLLTVFNTPHSLKLGIVHNCQKMIKQIIVTLINNPAQKISYFRNEKRGSEWTVRNQFLTIFCSICNFTTLEILRNPIPRNVWVMS